MKRMLTVITVLLVALTLSPRAAAEGATFGVRAETILPLGFSSVSLSIPLPGIEVGYNFGEETQPGFGVRAALTSLIFVTKVSVDAVYRVPVDAVGSGWYFGAGADLLLVPIAPGWAIFGAHAMAGYTFAVSNSFVAFLEVLPGAFFASDSSLFGTGNSLFYVSIAGGLRFRL